MAYRGAVAVGFVALCASACSLALGEGFSGEGSGAPDASTVPDGGVPPLGDAAPADAGDGASAGDAAVPPVDPDLLAWWRLDDATGATAKDGTGNGRDGEVRGAATWTTGKAGGAIAFSDASQYVRIANHPALVVTTQFSIALWLRVDGGDLVAPRVFSAGYAWSMKLNNGRPQVYTGENKYAASSFVIPVGAWHHVAITFDRGSVGIYIDGFVSSKLSDTFVAGDSVPVDTSATSARIGLSEDDRYPLTGTVDDVRYYRRALTAAEVKSLAVE